jgi:hypothetical protein
MGKADHGAFHDAGNVVDQAFDLFGIDVIAARDHQILVAPDDAQIAVIADLAQIAGDEEPVLAEFRGGLFRHLPIALKDVGAAHLDGADLALRQRRAGSRSVTRISIPGSGMPTAPGLRAPS